MKRKYTLSFAIVLLIITGFSFFPSKTLPERIKEALDVFSQHFYQEKVYLQFDKDYYVAGRTVWYKAYVTLKGRPTQLSSILYVDLLNDSGRVIQRNKRPIKDGGAYGDFELDTSLPAGRYHIRAYTMWMRNFNSDFFYHKDLPVYHPKGKISDSNVSDTLSSTKEGTKAGKTNFSVQFFPEGGDLVDSLESLVAFKAINQEGLPVKVSGIIRNSDGEIVDSIHSVHDGMGSFSLIPEKGKGYLAIMEDASGQKKNFPLPKAKPYGVVLKVVKVDNNRSFFQVKRHVKDKEANNNFEIAAQIQGQLAYLASVDFKKGYFSGLIPTETDPAGIMQITLFSEKAVPLAERLIFIKKKNAILDLSLSVDQESFDKRGKNSYTLQLPDSIQGNFSVAVTDADQVLKSPNQDNIISDLLLTNDLRGNVYNPSWYFHKQDSATKEGLKLVMMTNGWRRFKWKKILNNQFPDIQYAPEPDGLYFVGRIQDKKGLPVAGGKINILMRSQIDSSTRFMFGTAQDDGLFKIDHLSFIDSSVLYYKATNPKHKRKPVEVKFSKRVEPVEGLSAKDLTSKKLPFSDRLIHAIQLAEDQNKIDQMISNRSIRLKEVEVKAKQKSKEETMDDKYTSGMFKSDNGYSFDLTDQPLPYTNILDFLVGRVPGLQVRTSDPTHPSVTWRGGTPGFFLDEIPIELDEISNIPVDNVAYIKVYRPPFMGSFGGANGAIAIYTRKGKDIKFRPGEGLNREKVQGYTRVKEFYSPDYSVKSDKDKLPDKRATLYWNPKLRADSITHKLNVSFYNSDLAKRIRVEVEGMTKSGQLVHVDTIMKE